MSAKIAKEIGAIQRGLGEKVGLILVRINIIIIGFVLAYITGWKLALILSGVIPFLLLTGVAMGIATSSGVVQQMRAYSQSAGYAEQALNAIRVVHSYGQEDLENDNYRRYLERASKV